MKTLGILFILLSSLATAQSRYESAVLKGKSMLFADNDIAGYQNAANYFERIANKETDQWLPLYYQAVALAFLSTNQESKEERESTLNKSLTLIEKAEQLAQNSETLALKGFVQMLRLSVDPATRGQVLSPVILGLFEEALKLDDNNPRALLFKGQMLYGMAQFFGQGKEEACGYFGKAMAIFETDSTQDSIFPTWGELTARQSLASCNNE